MIDIALDPKTNDLLLVEAGATLVFDVDQVAQNLAIRLRFVLGEWFLDTLAGIPYYQYFFIKNPNQIQVESFLKQEISNTRGVLQITSFDSSYNDKTRSFSVQFGCQATTTQMFLDLELP